MTSVDPPFGAVQITQSLTGLARRLRTEGLTVTPDDLATALQACALLQPRSLNHLYAVLYPCLVKTFTDDSIFRSAFWSYFQHLTADGGEGLALWATALASSQTGPSEANDALAESDPAGESLNPNSESRSETTGGSSQPSLPAWAQALIGQIPEDAITSGLAAWKAFLQGHPERSAALLIRHPWAHHDKTRVAQALAELAGDGVITPQNWPYIEQTLTRYLHLVHTVDALSTAGPSVPRPAQPTSNSAVHRRHAMSHVWRGAAAWTLDLSPQQWSASLDPLRDADREILLTAIHAMAAQLRPDFSAEPRHAHRARAFDFRRTLHRSLGTFGEPFTLVTSARRIRLRRLVTVCDLSGSVKSVTALFLAFVYGLHQAFGGRAQHFAFVSAVDEITAHFSAPSYAECIDAVLHHSAIDYRGYSDYGALWTQMTAEYAGAFEGNPIVLVLGDARTNRYDPQTALLTAIARRARALYWLNPESESQWSTGDSAVLAYRTAARFIEIHTFDQLVRFLYQLPGMVIA